MFVCLVKCQRFLQWLSGLGLFSPIDLVRRCPPFPSGVIVVVVVVNQVWRIYENFVFTTTRFSSLTSPIPPFQSSTCLVRSDFWFNSNIVLMHKSRPIFCRAWKGRCISEIEIEGCPLAVLSLFSFKSATYRTQEAIDSARQTVSICTYLHFIRRLIICGTQQHAAALSLINNLLTESKRLDDEMILTEVHLVESCVYREIGNLSKAKVALSFHCIS